MTIRDKDDGKHNLQNYLQQNKKLDVIPKS